MKKFLFTLLFAASAIFANSLAEIRASGKIRIGVQSEQPPFSFDDNGTMVGFEVDLAKELVKNLGSR